MFYNRSNELASLEREYAKEGARFSVIYGRRRVGKTALIYEYIKNKPALFIYATEANFLILETISKGDTKIGDIASRLEVPSTQYYTLLNEVNRLGYFNDRFV